MNILSTILQFAAAHALVLGLAIVSLVSLIAIIGRELRAKPATVKNTVVLNGGRKRSAESLTRGRFIAFGPSGFDGASRGNIRSYEHSVRAAAQM